MVTSGHSRHEAMLRQHIVTTQQSAAACLMTGVPDNEERAAAEVIVSFSELPSAKRAKVVVVAMNEKPATETA